MIIKTAITNKNWSIEYYPTEDKLIATLTDLDVMVSV